MVGSTLHDIKSKGKSIISEARVEIAVDKDILLCEAISGEQKDSWFGMLTGLRWLWMICKE